MSTHGGYRPGSGRKPGSVKPDEEKRKPMTFSFSPEIVEYLKSIKFQARTIEEAIKRTDEWKEYIRNKI